MKQRFLNIIETKDEKIIVVDAANEKKVNKTTADEKAIKEKVNAITVNEKTIKKKKMFVKQLTEIDVETQIIHWAFDERCFSKIEADVSKIFQKSWSWDLLTHDLNYQMII